MSHAPFPMVQWYLYPLFFLDKKGDAGVRGRIQGFKDDLALLFEFRNSKLSFVLFANWVECREIRYPVSPDYSTSCIDLCALYPLKYVQTPFKPEEMVFEFLCVTTIFPLRWCHCFCTTSQRPRNSWTCWKRCVFSRGLPCTSTFK